MVNLVDCSKKEFINRVKDKKIYCFGAGKYFQNFINNRYEIDIEAIIDNYYPFDKKEVVINNKTWDIKVFSVDKFAEICDENSVVIITCFSVEDILEQLDCMEECDGLECYVERFIAEFPRYEKCDIKLNRKYNEQKKMVDACAERNFKNAVEKFQIWECKAKTNIAGSKAPIDIKRICESVGYKVIKVRPYKGDIENWSYQRLSQDWNKCLKNVSQNSIVLLQHPFLQQQEIRNETLLKLKEQKNVKIISLVHDVENLRKEFISDYAKAEFNFMLQIADVLIVHNLKMQRYFLDLGVKEEKIVSLDVFDYLLEEKAERPPTFERSISIAGNLDIRKCPYINKMWRLAPLKVHLYGPNYSVETNEKKMVTNVKYHGSFSADKIGEKLNYGFGLIWDGDSLDSCRGNTGEYLRYNNPHKLSLYLAAGLPVIIWKDAAEAKFVESNKIGFTIDSLYDLIDIFDNVNEKKYIQYLDAVNKVSSRIQKGMHTMEAIKKAENLLRNK